jgi:tRNA-specific adenosine deaminase 2
LIHHPAPRPQAQRAQDEGEVPVGCVLVRGDAVVARGRNATNASRNGTRHCEFVAVDALLAAHAGDAVAARFPECTLYVTCEPCIMCAGALSLLGVAAVAYGCANDKFGGNGSIVPVHELGCGACCAAGDRGEPTSGPAAARPAGGGAYLSRGGLLGERAIQLLQDFYIAGNPNGAWAVEQPSRRLHLPPLTTPPPLPQLPSRIGRCAGAGWRSQRRGASKQQHRSIEILRSCKSERAAAAAETTLSDAAPRGGG